MKRFAAVLLTFAAGAGTAVAAPPASQDACLEQAFALAEKAAAKKFAAEMQAKVEGQLTALEGKCAANDLAGAEGDIKIIEAEIAGG